jgi:endonuclease/exonuclease/phosphatase (EEP) superfamily protein YafD
MHKILLTMFFALIFNLDPAHARVRPLGHYYKIPAIENAHVIEGVAQNLFLDPKSINVFVWNIKKASMMTWSTEFQKYGQGKDLILVQEAYQNPVFEQTLKKFPEMRWDMAISFYYTIYNNQGTGNMIGSKVAPSDVLVQHTVDLEPGVETPKSTTYAKYPVEGSSKDLLVISVHGINLTSYDSFVRHMDQIEEQMGKHEGPILFAGDFNTRTKARTFYLLSMAERLGFKTVQWKNGDARMKFKLTSNYLDHGFVRGLSIKNAEVYPESTGSDHKPMSLELALQD